MKNILQQPIFEAIGAPDKEYKNLTKEQKEEYIKYVEALKIAIAGDPDYIGPLWDMMFFIGKKECVKRINKLARAVTKYRKINKIYK